MSAPGDLVVKAYLREVAESGALRKEIEVAADDDRIVCRIGEPDYEARERLRLRTPRGRIVLAGRIAKTVQLDDRRLAAAPRSNSVIPWALRGRGCSPHPSGEKRPWTKPASGADDGKVGAHESREPEGGGHVTTIGVGEQAGGRRQEDAVMARQDSGEVAEEIGPLRQAEVALAIVSPAGADGRPQHRPPGSTDVGLRRRDPVYEIRVETAAAGVERDDDQRRFTRR